MGVVISCFARVGGIGISNVLYHTARAAYRAEMLDRVICYGNRQAEIPPQFIRPIRFQPAKAVSFLKARYYYTLKRMTLDKRSAAYLRRRGCDIFHGWTTECVRSLAAAKAVGAKSVVERPAPHPALTRRLLREEYDRWNVPFPGDGGPRWMRGIDASHRDKVVAPEEFRMADRLIVQSDFCARSFLEEGTPAEKLRILVRAVDLREFAPLPERKDRKFRVLYAGTVCLRKGFLDLAKAWTDLALPDGELHVVGQVHDEVAPLLASYRGNSSISFHGHLREGAGRFFAGATVFALPSIVEGSAKATFEAMAAALPVVTTPNSGSVVRDGVDGFIVPVRSPEAIRERLLFLYGNRDAVREMGESARRRMAEFSWDAYEQRVVSLYRELLGKGAAA